MKKLLILVLLLLAVVYGVKLQKEINTLQESQINFEQSIDCLQHIQDTNGVCD